MDNLTKAQRSYCMSRVRSSDTNLERVLRRSLHRRGLRFRKNVRSLPGKPDIVFLASRVVVFVDGDFWHGYRFPAWCNKLSPFWQAKIAQNRARDRRNFARLRRNGWCVFRVWQHDIERNLDRQADLIETAVLGRMR